MRWLSAHSCSWQLTSQRGAAACVLTLVIFHVSLAHLENVATEPNRMTSSCGAPVAFLQQERQLMVAPSSQPQITGYAPECVVALTYDPSPTQMQRLLRYASELRQLAKFTLIIDETRPLRGKLSVRERLKTLGADGLDVYSFSEGTALARNSEFRRFWNAWPPNAKRKYPAIAAWFMPVVLLDWFRTVRPLHCENVWVITDDVGFSGNIANLIEWYRGDPSDLIQGSYERFVGSSWPLFRFQPKPLLAEVWRRNSPLRFRLDNTQRLSLRTMQLLSKYSDMGVIGTGEVWIPTIAGFEGYSVKSFDPRLVGHTFFWDGRVGFQEWLNLRRQNASKLFHALKF